MSDKTWTPEEIASLRTPLGTMPFHDLSPFEQLRALGEMGVAPVDMPASWYRSTVITGYARASENVTVRLVNDVPIDPMYEQIPFTPPSRRERREQRNAADYGNRLVIALADLTREQTKVARLEADLATLRAALGHSTDNSPTLGGDR